MSRIFVRGVGAVSPAGWGVEPLRQAVEQQRQLAVKELARPGWKKPLRVRTVPAPDPRPAFFGHARLAGPTIIKERVRAIGAQLAIDSAPGRGTRLEVLMPQDAHA